MVAAVILELAERAAQAGRVAIDTEFVSERRYQALLCLAQVAVPDAEAPDGARTEVIDPLADDPPDPAPLARVLADRSVEVVMHAGRQDVALLKRSWRTEVTNVFDTQVAAGFLGHGNQEGYESLVRKVLRVQLKGSEGFTRWDRRPLTDKQLEYAADDARLLLSLGDQLERRLEQRGRLGWAREECRGLEEVSDDRDPDRLYERLPRLGRLGEGARGVARELVEWRERAAREADRPPSTVLPDQALVELARRTPEGPQGPRADPRPAAADAPPARRRPPARRSRAGADAPPHRRRRSRRRATRPTLRSCRSRRRSYATARWSPEWRSS